MELRNIHFTGEDDAPSIEQAAPSQPVAETRLRLRKVKVSPHEEYALRDGEVRPISDALAALICCRKGRAEIGPKGITVDRKDIGGKRIYHHVDSVLCNDLSQRERKIFYVLNSLKPDVIHLLDDTGRYLESLPEKAQPGVLNNAEQAREYADQKRQVSRLARHLQELHGEDTKEAVAALQHNAEQMKGIVQILGTKTPSPTNEPAPSALGELVQRGTRRINDARALRQSAISIGRAVAAEARYTPPQDEPAAEDWSDNPRHTNPTATFAEDWSTSPTNNPRTPTPTPTESIESW